MKYLLAFALAWALAAGYLCCFAKAKSSAPTTDEECCEIQYHTIELIAQMGRCSAEIQQAMQDGKITESEYRRLYDLDNLRLLQERKDRIKALTSVGERP